MLWDLEHGEHEGEIRKQAERDRQPLPKFILEKPVLADGLGLFLDSFFDLSTERGGMGGPIPWSKIRDYCNEYEIVGDQREDFFYHIRAMDAVVLKHMNKGSGNGSSGVRSEDGTQGGGSAPPVRPRAPRDGSPRP